MNEEEKRFLQAYNPRLYESPLSTVDVAIFTLMGETLSILLVQRGEHPEKGKWALPGGFVDIHQDENLEKAALRKLKEKTGVSNPYLEQVRTVGNGLRDPRGWSLTILYLALVSPEEILPAQADNHWFPVTASGVDVPLAFDHASLLMFALDRLRGKVEYTAIPAHLLPEEFTLTELQRVFEIILGRTMEKSAFRRRIHEAGVVEPVPGKMRLGSNRPAQLYRRKEQASSHFFQRNLKRAD